MLPALSSEMTFSGVTSLKEMVSERLASGADNVVEVPSVDVVVAGSVAIGCANVVVDVSAACSTFWVHPQESRQKNNNRERDNGLYMLNN